MTDADAARLFLLDSAQDEPVLADLTLGLAWLHKDGRSEELYPPMPISDVRPALEAMIREGLVELFDILSADQRTLSLSEALAAIADDENWVRQAATGEAAGIAIYLTEAGARALSSSGDARSGGKGR